MEKSREAFRTISEVAEWLDVPTHVLRFWESRFSQIKPVKRAGGRRYYRPSDMRIIGGVKTLLHDQGMTIRGVQKLFREQGIKHVSSFSPDLFGHDAARNDSDVIEVEATPVEDRSVSPSPAARSTRDASPDPILDEATAPSPADDVVFVHRRAQTPADETAPDTRVVNTPPPEIAAPADPVPEISAPAIPPTPQVPDTDPADDAPEHAADPGLAARVVVARRRHLRRDRDTLTAAVERLKSLRERLS